MGIWIWFRLVLTWTNIDLLLHGNDYSKRSMKIIYLYDIRGFWHAYNILVYLQKDKLCALVYDTPWYLYDQRDKRMILGLLQMCQNFKELWIGPLAPLNVETGSNVNIHP